MHKTTILSLILKLGEGYQRLHNRLVRRLHVGPVECDEMHAYVHTREQNLKPGGPAEHGESWLYLGVAASSKLIISYHSRAARRFSGANTPRNSTIAFAVEHAPTAGSRSSATCFTRMGSLKADAPIFRGLESVLLQSKPGSDGRSRNPHIAAMQAPTLEASPS